MCESGWGYVVSYPYWTVQVVIWLEACSVEVVAAASRMTSLPLVVLVVVGLRCN